MLRRIGRLAGWLTYSLLALICFAVAGHASFNLFVRSGVTKVPEVTGLSEADAAAELADQGLSVRRKAGSELYDEAIPVGHVVFQKPSAGSLVKRATVVDLRISLGPEQIEVPDLKGSSLQAAQVTLASVDLRLGRTASVYTRDTLPGTVLEQEPEPGTRVGRSAPVHLFVSQENRGETFLMPDLTYRDYEASRRYFEGRGFRLGNVKFEPYEGIQPGVVLRQYPLPGHPLRRRDVISLVVTTDGTGAV